MTWIWRYEDQNGAVVAPGDGPGDGGPGDGGAAGGGAEDFPTQADAESWIGEHWRDLLDRGVEQVSLLENDSVVYGPMSLRPVE